MALPASYTLTLEPVSQTVVIRVIGPVDGALHQRVFQDIAARYDISRTNFLWNLTEASFSQFSIEEVKKMKQVRAEFAGKRSGVKSCIWINNSYERTLVRLYEDLNENISPKAELVFSEENARAYLGIPDDFELPRQAKTA